MKVLAVMSGKGGVGKSTVSTLIALCLAERSKVLLIDFDICGPSISSTLNVIGTVYKSEVGLVPVCAAKNLDVISMSSLISPHSSVIWRGPKKLATLDMFFDSISEKYGYVIIDTPPGLAEEHWFLCDKDIQAIHVSTPQNIALSDTVQTIEFCQKRGIEVLGVFENMSGLQCGNCSKVTNVFGANSVETLAGMYGIRYLGSLPVEVGLSNAISKGCLADEKENILSYKIVKESLDALLESA